MAHSSEPISGVAQRYAASLFELAVEEDAIDAVSSDVDGFDGLLKESDDLRRLVMSPAFSADEQLKAISAIVDKAGFGTLFSNFARVVASNRRLFVMPGIITAFRDMVAEHRGEVRADVITAHELSDAQAGELKKTLGEIAGKDVTMDVTVDPSLLGGLIVQIGSRQIDTSLRTKLSTLKLALKEVG
ncbi:F0F1 ATP synthase subunit delta [Pararhizobium mangrovi]|uniref:F0F1 ATP synthase subunit delta n=1 Tax=Pararhizobium mangrovi TaxID=2590452 RepID=UPI0015E82DDC|nr:F0F1 ATP synthase subunit delta [Pararhizobium mangrovi]